MTVFIFFPMPQLLLVCQGLLIIEASRSHSETPHSVGLLWARDQPDAETSIWQHRHSQQTSMPPTGFKPSIPTSERPQSHALDRTASGIGLFCLSSPLCCTEQTHGHSTTLKGNEIGEGRGGVLRRSEYVIVLMKEEKKYVGRHTTAANMLKSWKLKAWIIRGLTVSYKNVLGGSAVSVRGWLLLMLPLLNLRPMLLDGLGS